MINMGKEWYPNQPSPYNSIIFPGNEKFCQKAIVIKYPTPVFTIAYVSALAVFFKKSLRSRLVTKYTGQQISKGDQKHGRNLQGNFHLQAPSLKRKGIFQSFMLRSM